jgi:hypothetical protein
MSDKIWLVSRTVLKDMAAAKASPVYQSAHRPYSPNRCF